MADVLADVALAASGSLAMSIVVKATVLLALSIAGARLARRARASVRHAFLASMFGGLLLLPVAAIVAPPVTVEMSGAPLTTPMPDLPGVQEAGTIAIDLEPVDRARAGHSDDVAGRLSALSPSAVLAAVWAIGAALFLMPLVKAFHQLQRMRRRGLQWLEGQAMVLGLARAAGIHGRVEAVIHDAAASPMTCGFVHPMIVMPTDVDRWASRDLRRAVVHELEHVRRGDWLILLVARGICALYWFHPLVWSAWRQLHLDAERACDDAVLVGTERAAYAQQLVTLAKRLSSYDQTRAFLAMAGRTDLSARVTAVLDDRQRRGRAGAARVTAIATTAVVLLSALAPLRAVPAVRDQATTDTSSAAFEVTSITLNTSTDRGGARNPHARITTQSGGICPPWGRIQLSDTCFRATGVTVRELIAFGWGPSGLFGPSGLVAPRPPIVGGPTWIDSDRFDVVGRAPGNEPFGSPRWPAMVRTLLAERFTLMQHVENRTLSIDELVPDRSDRRTRPRLRPATADCAAKIQALRAANSGPRWDQPAGSRSPMPAISRRDPCIGGSGHGYVKGGAVDMWQLAQVLSNRLNRIVRDRTGLTGMFDIDFSWTTTQQQGASSPEPVQPAGDAHDRASILTALQEQLGLTLRAATGPVEVIVIDRASRPALD